MEKKKPFKYFAIRVGDMVVFRRTVNSITKIRSVLYNPHKADFRLEQITYTGGTVVGSISYVMWCKYAGAIRISIGSCKQIDRSLFRSLDPYICKER